MIESEKHFELLQELIDKAFNEVFKGENMKTQLATEDNELKPMGACARASAGEVFESIEDYKQKTGKRFRMTKEQKQRGLEREDAFTETFGENKNG